jgi:hypothetical protein
MTYQITPFRATFDSDCLVRITPECSGRIEEGEDVAYVDDEAACSDCVEYARVENDNSQQNWAQRLADRSKK